MQSTFKGKPTRTVKLVHGEQEIDLIVHPLPLGYMSRLDQLIPQPTRVKNGEQEPDPRKLSEWTFTINCLCCAKALADEMEAQPPSTSAPGEWAAYAAAVRAEFDAAGFLDGDLQAIAQAALGLSRGLGDLPNA